VFETFLGGGISRLEFMLPAVMKLFSLSTL